MPWGHPTHSNSNIPPHDKIMTTAPSPFESPGNMRGTGALGYLFVARQRSEIRISTAPDAGLDCALSSNEATGPLAVSAPTGCLPADSSRVCHPFLHTGCFTVSEDLVTEASAGVR